MVRENEEKFEELLNRVEDNPMPSRNPGGGEKEVGGLDGSWRDSLNGIRDIGSVDEFRRVVDENRKVVVWFSADWCGPCKNQKSAAERAAGRLDCPYVLVDEDVGGRDTGLHSEFDVSSLPRTDVFVDGVSKESLVAVQHANDIVEIARRF